MKSKFKKLLATALVLCLVLALLPAAAFADGEPTFSYFDITQYKDVDDGNSFDGGTVSVSDDNTLTITPNANYGIRRAQLKYDDTETVYIPISNAGAGLTYKIDTKSAATIQVQVGFKPFHTVTLDSASGDYITVENNSVMEGDWVIVTPTDIVGVTINSVWYTDGAGEKIPLSEENGQYKFQMGTSDVTVGADVTPVVSPTSYNIVVQTNIEGGQINFNSSSAPAGSTVTFTVTAYSGFEINEVCYYFENTNQKVILYGTNGTYSFPMPNGNIRLEASFTYTGQGTKYYPVTTSSNFGGTISDSGWATYGSDFTVKIEPYNGYSLKSIKVNGWDYIGMVEWHTNWWGYKYGILTFKVYGNTDVDVVFEEDAQPGTDYHYINVTNPGWHCSVNVPSGAYCGEDVTIKLSNFDTGYTLSYLKVDGVYVKPYAYNGYLAYTFKMPSHSVAIEVGTTNVSGKYYIDTSYDSTLGGVEVWVNNNYTGNNWHQGSWADHNDSVSFKVKPYYSDDVVSVSVVGKQTGWTYSYDYNSYSGWYTFSMPREDVTISVDFRSGVHKVYVDKVTDGKLTVSDDWAKYGQIVYITAVPDYGCTLSSLSVRTATGDSVHVYNAQKADTYYFYMPDQYVSVSAVFTGKYTSLPFNDVSYGDWYYDAVQFVYSRGIMDGVDYYKFAPNGTITRGMILTMLWRMAGEPFEMPVTSFTDVEIGRYYTTAVAWACRNGIADGMGESTFGPNDAITREELVTLLYRYAQYFGHSCIGTSIEGFVDAGSVSSYAYNAMCWAYKAGVVTGTTGSRLNPQGTASRAEAAQMIMSFYSFLNS